MCSVTDWQLGHSDSGCEDVRPCVCGAALAGVTSTEREREGGRRRKGQSESDGCGGHCVALKQPAMWEGSHIVNTLF